MALGQPLANDERAEEIALSSPLVGGFGFFILSLPCQLPVGAAALNKKAYVVGNGLGAIAHTQAAE
jgi:hypothetical protein